MGFNSNMHVAFTIRSSQVEYGNMQLGVKKIWHRICILGILDMFFFCQHIVEASIPFLTSICVGNPNVDLWLGLIEFKYCIYRYSGWWFGTFLCFHILGISSSQLTFIFFSEGWLNRQPDRYYVLCITSYHFYLLCLLLDPFSIAWIWMVRCEVSKVMGYPNSWMVQNGKCH